MGKDRTHVRDLFFGVIDLARCFVGLFLLDGFLDLWSLFRKVLIRLEVMRTFWISFSIWMMRWVFEDVSCFS